MDNGAGTNGTVYCTNCGHKLATDDQFCQECGTPRPIFSPGETPPPEFTSSVTTVDHARRVHRCAADDGRDDGSRAGCD